MHTQLPVEIITYHTKQHYGFLLSSLKSANLYKCNAEICLDNMLAFGSCDLLVSNDDHNVIYGAVIRNSSTILWIYIKETFRGFGLSRHLVKPDAKYFWLKGTNNTWHKWTKHLRLSWNPLGILMK